MRTCNPARRRLSRNSLPGSPRRFASSLRLRSASGRAKLGTPRTSELIDHPQSLELLPVRTAIEHEVVRINMVRVAGGKGSRSSRCISSSRPEAGHVYHCLLSEQIRPVGAHRKPRRSKNTWIRRYPNRGYCAANSRIAARFGALRTTNPDWQPIVDRATWSGAHARQS